MIGTLAPHWEAKCEDGAQQLFELRKRQAWRLYSEQCIDDATILLRSRMSCRTECLTAKLLHRPWRPNLTPDKNDVDGAVEVRARLVPTRYEPGTSGIYRGIDLGFRGYDLQKLDMPWVLAYVFDDASDGIKGHGTMDLIGWLYGQECLDAAGPTNFTVKYIGPPYRDIDSLIEAFAKEPR